MGAFLGAASVAGVLLAVAGCGSDPHVAASDAGHASAVDAVVDAAAEARSGATRGRGDGDSAARPDADCGSSDEEAVTSASHAFVLQVSPNPDAVDVSQDFPLAAAASCEAKVAWSSSGSALTIDSAAGMARVHRVVGSRGKASLSATFTRGSASATRSFDVVVLAWGFTTTQFAGLVAETESLDQLGALVGEIQAAQALVQATPSLISDGTARAGFLAQDATTAAAQMCTTVARYMYLYAYAVLAPTEAAAVPSRFRDYYVTVVDRGYVGTCSTCDSTYVWVNDGTSMIQDFVTAPVNEWSYDRGTTYPADEDIISAMKARSPQTTLFRDGASSTTSSHTFLVALEEDGTYGMLDTYFESTWTGKSIDDGTRFGPNGSRYLFSSYGYVPTETN